MNDAGYPFMSWNGRVYDQEVKEVGIYSEITQSEKPRSTFKMK